MRATPADSWLTQKTTQESDHAGLALFGRWVHTLVGVEKTLREVRWRRVLGGHSGVSLGLNTYPCGGGEEIEGGEVAEGCLW